MRKTKIICTIGPASGNVEILQDMIKAGMNFARVNMSHGSHESNGALFNLVKEAAKNLDTKIDLIVDTKGPEIRIGTFKKPEGIVLENNQTFTLYTTPTEGDETGVFVNYEKITHDVKPGNMILLNNGLIELVATSVYPNRVVCRVIAGGKLTNRKSMFLPNIKLSLDFLTEQDKSDLIFAIRINAPYVAASFVSYAKDVLDMKEFLKQNGGENIKIIAKIESAEGLKNAEEIFMVSDMVMIARGDLGVEIGFEHVPRAQRMLIRMAKRLNKTVITATEMLESMTYSPRPTRAEVTDVANAIYDGTDIIMLSGETASGKHPALVVSTMAKIAETAERDTDNF